MESALKISKMANVITKQLRDIDNLVESNRKLDTLSLSKPLSDFQSILVVLAIHLMINNIYQICICICCMCVSSSVSVCFSMALCGVVFSGYSRFGRSMPDRSGWLAFARLRLGLALRNWTRQRNWQWLQFLKHHKWSVIQQWGEKKFRNQAFPLGHPQALKTPYNFF